MRRPPTPSENRRLAHSRAAQVFREKCRIGQFTRVTAGEMPGHVQANLVIVPEPAAFEFLLFCQRNPKPCPILEVLDPGDPVPRRTAPTADVRADLPRYRVFENGELVDEPTKILGRWRKDLVSFLIGCSFSFDQALEQAGLEVRHWTEKDSAGLPRNVPMYRTTIPCQPAGRFRGPLVVSMRPFRPADAIRAVEVSSQFAGMHGSPIHWGDPSAIGIANLAQPDFGDAVTLQPGEVPVFWACGVTPQLALMEAKLDLAITHAPGHMFVTDYRIEEWNIGA